MKTIYWVVGVSLVGIATLIYLFLGDTQRSLPKIKLSYFTSEVEIAQSVDKILTQEITKQNFFWFGLEPEKNEQLEVLYQLKLILEKQKPFQKIIIDQELGLKKEWLEKFNVSELVAFKQNVKAVAEELAKLEKNNDRYLFITASIYSTPLIKQNQIHQIKLSDAIKPMTFSLAYFPTNANLEANMLFPCNTEDHSGTSDWGCFVANKARFMRRRIDEKNSKAWIGAMDLIGEKDYMLMLYKK